MKNKKKWKKNERKSCDFVHFNYFSKITDGSFKAIKIGWIFKTLINFPFAEYPLTFNLFIISDVLTELRLLISFEKLFTHRQISKNIHVNEYIYCPWHYSMNTLDIDCYKYLIRFHIIVLFLLYVYLSQLITVTIKLNDKRLCDP